MCNITHVRHQDRCAAWHIKKDVVHKTQCYIAHQTICATEHMYDTKKDVRQNTWNTSQNMRDTIHVQHQDRCATWYIKKDVLHKTLCRKKTSLCYVARLSWCVSYIAHFCYAAHLSWCVLSHIVLGVSYVLCHVYCVMYYMCHVAHRS